jgi:hypothetical protein
MSRKGKAIKRLPFSAGRFNWNNGSIESNIVFRFQTDNKIIALKQ